MKLNSRLCLIAMLVCFVMPLSVHARGRGGGGVSRGGGGMSRGGGGFSGGAASYSRSPSMSRAVPSQSPRMASPQIQNRSPVNRQPSISRQPAGSPSTVPRHPGAVNRSTRWEVERPKACERHLLAAPPFVRRVPSSNRRVVNWIVF